MTCLRQTKPVVLLSVYCLSFKARQRVELKPYAELSLVDLLLKMRKILLLLSVICVINCQDFSKCGRTKESTESKVRKKKKHDDELIAIVNCRAMKPVPVSSPTCVPSTWLSMGSTCSWAEPVWWPRTRSSPWPRPSRTTSQPRLGPAGRRSGRAMTSS